MKCIILAAEHRTINMLPAQVYVYLFSARLKGGANMSKLDSIVIVFISERC